MEHNAVARIVRALFVRRPYAKRLTAGIALGLSLTLLAFEPLAMTEARATTAVGAIHGTGGVTSYGGASYTIPIQVPPGTNGMQPSLALVYNSQSGDGWAGYGWTLSGLSNITRCPHHQDDDGTGYNVPIRYNSGDDFCMDGQKLRLISGTSGTNGATYGTQLEGFSIVTSYTDASATGGPSYFTVQTKDGRSYEYGNTSDSKIFASGTTAVRTWALDKVTDASNNFMTYQYSGSTTPGREYWPVSILYTKNGTTGADHEVDFTFVARPTGTVKTQYVHGSVSRNSKLLSAITIKYNTTISFTYNLGYDQDPANNRNRLISVQECGTDGSCLPSTAISWTNAHAGWLADTSTGISVADSDHALAAHLMDVDGDGIADLVYPDTTSSDWQVAFGQPSGGFGTPIDTGDPLYGTSSFYKYALAIDYNGDGKMDLVVPVPGGWQVLVSTGGHSAGAGGVFFTPPNSIPDMSATNSVTGQPMYQGNVWFGSSYGTGLGDMFNNTGTVIKWWQNGGPPSETFPASGTTVYSSGAMKALTNRDFIDVNLDFNGSGRVGALVYNNTSGAWNGLNPSGNTLGVFGSITGSGSVAAMPFDANGDGLTDLLTVDGSNNWQLSLSMGTGFNTLSSSEPYSASSGRDPLVADYYGDGTQVALVYNSTTSAWDLLDAGYSATTGNFSFSVTPGVAAPYSSTILSGSVRVGSIESKGLDDLVWAVLGGGVYTWHYKLHAGATSLLPDVVTQVTDGLGNYCQFQYASTSAGTSTYAQTVARSYPVHALRSFLAVVSNYIESDGIGGSYTKTFTYNSGAVDSLGHGFLGFAGTTDTDSRSGNVETLAYDQTFPYVGMVTSDVVKKSNGDFIREADATSPDQMTLPPGPDGSQRYFPFFDTQTTYDYDILGSSVQQVRTTVINLPDGAADFDQFGNLKHDVTTVTDLVQAGSPQYSNNVTFAYPLTALANNCVGSPDSETIVRSTTSPVASLTRSITYTMDRTHCRLNSQTVTGGTTSLTTSHPTASFDAYGNPTETDTSGTGLAARVETASFTNQNHEFPVTSTRAPSSTVSLTFHEAWRYDLGLPTSSTDPNGNQTYIPTTAVDGAPGYDGFGRAHQIDHPDGSASLRTYAACPGGTYCPATAAYEVTEAVVASGSSSPLTTGFTAYDSLGRVVQRGSVLLGGVISRIDTTYDTMGNLIEVSKPYLTSTTLDTYYIYDFSMERILELDTPQDGSDSCAPAVYSGTTLVTPTTCHDYTTFAYNGFTVTAHHAVSNSASSSSTQIVSQTRDAIGEILSSVDAAGHSTGYGYDPFGDLSSMQDVSGHVTSITYDGLGHKTGMTDPNLGIWAFQVDALGEVTCQTDAKLQSIILAYDGIGRVLTKTETSPQTGPDCTPAPADKIYVGTWIYDTATKGLGLPASVSDLNGFVRTYDYDGISRPADVSTTPGTGATAYTTSTGYDSFGRLATLTYPATVSGTPRFEVTYNYDALSGALSSVSDTVSSFKYWQAATGGSSAPVDAFGHILGYVDGNGVSTVTTYDQATGAVTGFGTAKSTDPAGVFSVQDLSYSWDGFGNLKQRCDANRGLIENLSYEGLNRLSGSQIYSHATAGTCPASTSTAGANMGLTYGAIGTIQTRTNTGIPSGSGTLNQSYNYNDTSHPYAVTSISDTTTSVTVASYAYDADGNMVCRDPIGTTCTGTSPTPNITWSDDNLLLSISEGSNSSVFSYGPDLQRYQQSVLVGTGTVSTTYYVGDLFEVVTASGDTKYRHSIMASGGVVAVHTIDQAGTTTTVANTYVHSDHLDSADVLTDDSGNIAVDPVTGQQQVMSFDAFGMRRNPADWSYNLSSISVPGLRAFTDRGYTSQEQLDNVGLVHMNGRVYDPGIGRFISVDPIVPGDRYAYLHDNPLNDTDPTGYFGIGDLIPSPSSPLNPVTGPINVINTGASAAVSAGKDILDAGEDLLLKGADIQLDIARSYTKDVWNVGKDYTHDVRGLISSYTHGALKLASDYTAFVKHAPVEAQHIFAHPAIYTEYQIPVLGNLTNIEIRRSPALQEGGTLAAAILSDFWGPEIDAGWAAYLNDVKSNESGSGFVNFREGLYSWGEDEGINFASDYYSLETSPNLVNFGDEDEGLFSSVSDWYKSLSTTKKEGLKTIGRAAWHHYGPSL